MAAALLLLASPSFAKRFQITSGKARFESKAPLESFDGKTENVTGFVVVDPDNLGDSVTVYVEVDLASLDTGIDKRNRHMRENHLETDRYPVATFRGATLRSPHGASLRDGETATLEITGNLEVHGVKKPLRTTVDVTYSGAKESTIHTIARFKLKLSDFDIERPRFLFLKLSEDVGITLDVTATTSPDS